MLEQLTAVDVSQVSSLWRKRRDAARLQLIRQPAHPSASIWRMQTRVLTYMLRRYCGEYIHPNDGVSATGLEIGAHGAGPATMGRCLYCERLHRRAGWYCHNCGRARLIGRPTSEVVRELASVRRASNIACAWTAIAILILSLSFGSIVLPAILEGR